MYFSLIEICKHLGIATNIIISSNILFNNELKGQEKVIAICEALRADTYINAIGGVELYAKEDFYIKGINLQFIKARPFEYEQFGAEFVPWLSIVDVLMFNPLDAVRACINKNYDLV